MRIRIIIPSRLHPDYINAEMCDLLRRELPACGEAEIVDLSPDIVHIFGIWNSSFAKRVEAYRNIGVPVVFTSLDGILSLKKSSGGNTHSITPTAAVRRVAKSGAIIHVCGKFERSTIIEVAKYADVRIISNASHTATTDTATMTAQTIDLYRETIDTADRLTREKINKKLDKIDITDHTIRDICSRILYIKQRIIMCNLPQVYLDQTSHLLINSDYNEKEMRNVLEQLKLTRFAAYTMTLLAESSTLTEGFMPLESDSGKTVEKMKKYIIK